MNGSKIKFSHGKDKHLMIVLRDLLEEHDWFDLEEGIYHEKYQVTFTNGGKYRINYT